MRTVTRFEVHKGSRPGERRAYARLDNGELRRLNREQERLVLIRYDNQQNKKESIVDRFVKFLVGLPSGFKVFMMLLAVMGVIAAFVAGC